VPPCLRGKISFAVPDTRKHRGPHPEDARLFAPAAWPRLASAVADLSLLLTRGYAQNSALKIVGDRHELTARQRMAVARAACPDDALQRRKAAEVDRRDLAGQGLLIDGYNLLMTIETALAGGLVFRCRDGCLRDIAGVHGTYRKVDETIPAIEQIGAVLARLAVSRACWILDSPVSNSGRLATILRGVAAQHTWPWETQLLPRPDPVLIQSSEIVATADSAILDRTTRWFNLAAEVVCALKLPSARISVDLAPAQPS